MESLVDEGVIAEIKSQWKRMWQERFDDHVRAEGVAFQDYDHLFVERGTVVLATRDFRLLSLKDILDLHKVANAERLVPLNPVVGGWGKFVRTHISSRSASRRRVREFVVDEKKPQQLKKGGRGWLHV